MADDSLVEPGKDAQAAAQGGAANDGAKSGGSEDAAKGNGKSAALDPNELLAQIDQRVESRMGALGQLLLPALKEIAGHMEASGGKPSGGSGESAAESDPTDEFFRDPDAAIRSIVAKELQPFLQTQASNVQARTLAEQKQHYDTQYGEGTFDKVIAPDLARALGGMRDVGKANEEVLRTTVHAIAGQHQDELFEARTKLVAERAKKAQEDAAVPGPGMLRGGTRAPARSDHLSPEERDFIATLNKLAPNHAISEKEYLDARQRGGTEEAWESQRKPFEQAGLQ